MERALLEGSERPSRSRDAASRSSPLAERALVVESVEGERTEWSCQAVQRATTLAGCVEIASEGDDTLYRTPVSATALHALAALAEEEPGSLRIDVPELADLLQLLKGADYLDMPGVHKSLSTELGKRLTSAPREQLMEQLGVECDLSEEEQKLASTESILTVDAHHAASLAPLLVKVVEDAGDLIEQTIKQRLWDEAEEDLPMLVRGLRKLEGMSRSWRAMVRRALCSRCFSPGIKDGPTDKPFLFSTGLGLNLVVDALRRFPTITRMHAAPFQVDVLAVRKLQRTHSFADVRGCVLGEGEPPCALLLAAHAARYGEGEGFNVPESAFACTSLTTIDLPAGLTSIGARAFQTCTSLTTICLPAGVTSIGASAFQYCTSLTRIELPVSLTSIGTFAFCACTSLTAIDLPAGLTSIGKSAFCECTSLMKIDLPASLTTIENRAFSDCTDLTTIDLPAGVTSIGEAAFTGCESLTTIDLHVGLTSIGRRAFFECASLTMINSPAGLTSIGDEAFYDCQSLTTINLPASLTSIGKRAFFKCTSLTKISVPASLSLSFIGDDVFHGCTAQIDLSAFTSSY